MTSSNRVILIDADVVSHFVTGNEADALHQIFPENPIYMLDKVHAELQRWASPRMLSVVSALLSKRKIHLMDFPEEDEIIKKEYTWIKSMMFKGDGESACLAVAKYQKNILASSNLKDIKSYCVTHKIDYLTTMDFLCEALRTGLFDEVRCNRFVSLVLTANSKLPVKKMSDYTCRAIDFLK
jgi:hypothetical protein